MDIFKSRPKKISRRLRTIFPLLFLVAVCLCFLRGIDLTDEETRQKEQFTLEQALQKSAVRTYALTGRYPENLSELLSQYHITYNPEKYLVEYTPSGSNLFPQIQVIPLGEKGGAS